MKTLRLIQGVQRDYPPGGSSGQFSRVSKLRNPCQGNSCLRNDGYASAFFPMWYNFSVTDLVSYESDAVAVELNEHEARSFGVNMAHELLGALPDLARKGLCIVVYDLDDRPVSIVPLDPVQ